MSSDNSPASISIPLRLIKICSLSKGLKTLFVMPGLFYFQKFCKMLVFL